MDTMQELWLEGEIDVAFYRLLGDLCCWKVILNFFITSKAINSMSGLNF